MDIRTKSIGFLIDQLITTSMRCWFAQEDIMNPELTESERLAAATRAQLTNSIRSELIRAIDQAFGEEGITMGVTKTYHTYQDRNE